MSTSTPATGPSFETVSASPAETLALGRRLAGLLRPGDVVLLVGRLGAGKTLLASGIAEGLGVQDPVTSPSFVILRSYDGFLPLHHADVYRLTSTGEFDDLDLFSSAADGVVLIEWGDVVAGAVPPDHLVVDIHILADDARRISFTGAGDWQTRALEGLAV
jgi:tRNA threonylcarbamoyladenosine biosynthesis protein TsaE